MTIEGPQRVRSIVDWRHGNFEETGKTKKIYNHEKKRSQEFLYLHSPLADRIPCTYIVSDFVFFLSDVYEYESNRYRGICGAG